MPTSLRDRVIFGGIVRVSFGGRFRWWILPTYLVSLQRLRILLLNQTIIDEYPQQSIHNSS